MGAIKQIVCNINLSLVVIKADLDTIEPYAISYDHSSTDATQCKNFLNIIISKQTDTPKYIVYTSDNNTISIEVANQKITVFQLTDFSDAERIVIDNFLTYCKNKF